MGELRNCEKGDGVLEVPSSDGHDMVGLVVEMTTTGAARRWGPYLLHATCPAMSPMPWPTRPVRAAPAGRPFPMSTG